MNIIPVTISQDIKSGEDLGAIILQSLKKSRKRIFDNDILVIAHKIVSKAEGRIVKLDSVKPSEKAIKLAQDQGKDPRLAEIILREAMSIVKASKGVIIAETKHGFVCANAGVDQSNIVDGYALLLPADPDRSAQQLKNFVKKKTRKDIAVIITDTFGRPFRNGQTNVAVGVAGINAVKSYIGSRDMYGRKLKVTEIAIADEIASAAELVMGKSDRVPVAIIRGYDFEKTKSSVSHLLRSRQSDLFR